MDSLISEGRALPAHAALPATIVSLSLIVLLMRSTNGRSTRFVLFAIWLRFVLSAFHPVTFEPSPIGLSWNALGSVFVCAAGVLTLHKRRLSDIGMVPFYVVFAAILASGLVNHDPADTFDMIVKYLYLAVIALNVADALEENGWEYTLSRMVWPFLVPLGFQFLSVVLGVYKLTELDNSISYIGGFKHEAGFSVSLAGGLLVLCLRRNMALLPKVLLIGLCFAGIMLANYRTSIVALAPLVGAVAVIGASRSVISRQRKLVVGAFAIVVATLGLGLATTQQERFADIGTALSRGTDLIQPVAQYPEADRHIMSGRFLIWSGYLYGYAEGTPLQHVFGLGPNSWETQFKVYAHNTLVSALYELGVFGVLAMLFLWGWMLALSVLVRSPSRAVLVAAHLCFFILNMATMPLWMIEGMIFYGILCGGSIYVARTAPRHRTRALRAGGLTVAM